MGGPLTRHSRGSGNPLVGRVPCAKAGSVTPLSFTRFGINSSASRLTILPETYFLFPREHDEMIARRSERFALEATVDSLHFEACELQHELQLVAVGDPDRQVVRPPGL